MLKIIYRINSKSENLNFPKEVFCYTKKILGKHQNIPIHILNKVLSKLVQFDFASVSKAPCSASRKECLMLPPSLGFSAVRT